MPDLLNQIKDTVDQLGATFTEFRAAQDRENAEAKRLGAATGEAKAAVDKANAAITALEAKLDEQKKLLQGLETETARNATLSAGDRKDTERDNAQRFFNMAAGIRNTKPVTVGAEHVERYRGYAKALEAYFRRKVDNDLTPEIHAALSVGSDPAGGYWVLPDTSGAIAKFVYETSPMRQYASVQAIGTDRLIGFNDLGEDSSAAGWVGENASRPETDTPEIGKWEIPVHEQYANPKASKSVLDDASVDIGAWLEGKVAARLARREATAFVSGNGVSKPRGFLDYASASAPGSTPTTWKRVEYTKTGVNGGFHATLPGDVFITAIGLLKTPYLQGAIWAMNRTTKAAARKIKDGQGNYLMLPDFREGFKEVLLGMPVAGFEDMPAIATGSDSIALANFKEGYQIVDRQGIQVLRDPYTAKPFVHFYTTRRVGGDVVNFEAIKLIRFAA